MTGLFPFLATAIMLGTTAGQQIQDVFTGFGKGVAKEIVTVKRPVEETVSYAASSQCSTAKNFIDVDYNQMKGRNEPDVDQLNLVLRTRTMNETFKLASAPAKLAVYKEYNPSLRLTFFLHGFLDDPYKDSFQLISDAYLRLSACNILALDSSPLIHWFYLRSSTYVRFIGQKLGMILASLVHRGQDPATIHLIGHSLGAHISSFAGKEFNKLTGQKLGRITGLDPAGPCFSHLEQGLRLQADDADFVDVIHTDAGVFGLRDRMGHLDFYPNEGRDQPECFFPTCGHSRSWQLYGESVDNPDAFPAVACDNWDDFRSGQCYDNVTRMGLPASADARGLFFLQTNGKSPYGRKEAGMTFNNEDGIVKNVLHG